MNPWCSLGSSLQWTTSSFTSSICVGGRFESGWVCVSVCEWAMCVHARTRITDAGILKTSCISCVEFYYFPVRPCGWGDSYSVNGYGSIVTHTHRHPYTHKHTQTHPPNTHQSKRVPFDMPKGVRRPELAWSPFSKRTLLQGTRQYYTRSRYYFSHPASRPLL